MLHALTADTQRFNVKLVPFSSRLTQACSAYARTCTVNIFNFVLQALIVCMVPLLHGCIPVYGKYFLDLNTDACMIVSPVPT